MRRSATEPERVTLLLVADAGGHLFELAGLREVWSRFSRVWVTVHASDVETLLTGEQVLFAHGQTRRSLKNLVRNGLLAVRVVRRLRPAVVVTTGAGLSVPFAWVGRAFGARVVYIECSGRIGVSVSCRLVAPVADRLYVQWPEVVGQVAKARYAGTVLLSRR
ncbi:MAG: PssD/Cps14F family polysaccharide biosynthesis glycosyltransferase [Gaiellaceae bacterium]